MRKPKFLNFANCPICGEPYPAHSLRVIRILSSERKGRYVVWCGNQRKIEVLYKQK